MKHCYVCCDRLNVVIMTKLKMQSVTMHWLICQLYLQLFLRHNNELKGKSFQAIINK